MIRAVELRRANVDVTEYPFSIPAIAALETLDLHPGVTLFAGENGSGKSTLIEGIAVAAGFNAEGGSRNFMLTTHASHSSLHDHLHLVRDARPQQNGFFLRAESFYNVATYVEALGPEILAAYGGTSLHDQSHGESFLSLVLNRFKGKGLYILDEPEAALSLRGQLALIRRIHELVEDGSQFLVSTHSPILLAFPGARIYVLSPDGVVETTYDETEPVELTRAFLADPARFLHYLFAEE